MWKVCFLLRSLETATLLWQGAAWCHRPAHWSRLTWCLCVQEWPHSQISRNVWHVKQQKEKTSHSAKITSDKCTQMPLHTYTHTHSRDLTKEQLFFSVGTNSNGTMAYCKYMEWLHCFTAQGTCMSLDHMICLMHIGLWLMSNAYYQVI